MIGAGTYAANGVVAVSCTGLGEYFIRRSTSHDIAARIRYRGETLGTATDAAIDDLTEYKCGAGLIAVDAGGTIAMPHNTEGMYRGSVTADGVFSVGIYRMISLPWTEHWSGLVIGARQSHHRGNTILSLKPQL